MLYPDPDSVNPDPKHLVVEVERTGTQLVLELGSEYSCPTFFLGLKEQISLPYAV
jgi:hypothetical protein